MERPGDPGGIPFLTTRQKMKSFKIQCLCVLFLLVGTAGCYEPTSLRNTPINEYLISQNEFFQPYTFDMVRNTQEYVGILWVKDFPNGTETIMFNYYDGLELSNDTTIAPYKPKATYFVPRGISHDGDIYFSWIETLSCSTFDINLRIFYSNGSFSPNIKVAEDRTFNDSDGYDPLWAKSASLRLACYDEILYIFWQEQGLNLHHIIYYPKSNSFSPIIPILDKDDYEEKNCWAGPYDVLATDASIIILCQLYHGYGPEPGLRQLMMKYNFTNASLLNHSIGSPDLINKSIIYEYLEHYPWYQSMKAISYEDQLYVNFPANARNVDSPVPSIEKWTLKIYTPSYLLEKEIPILGNLTDLTKSTIHGYDGKIYAAYFESCENNQTRLEILSIDNDTVSDSEVLSDEFFCNYSEYMFSTETQCYIALHTVMAHELRMLCCVWACQDTEGGPFKLKLTKMYSEPYIKCHLDAEKTTLMTYEMNSFTGQVSSSSEVQFQFEFGDETGTGWSACPMAQHQYSNDGIYRVGVRARTIKGLTSDWDYDNITVLNRPPVLNGHMTPDKALTMETFSFFVDDASDIDGGIVDLQWDFGDGNFSQNLNASHSYSDHGLYNASFTAKDDDGAVSLLQFNVTVENRPPCVVASTSAIQVHSGEAIRFSSCGTYDMDGQIISIRWEFGDTATSPFPDPEHEYTQPGTYSVRLEAVDDDGATNSSEFEIHVVDNDPIADFWVEPAEGTIMTEFNFISKSMDIDGNITEYFWDFGDGQTGASECVSHRYGQKGEYWPSLQVIDDNGSLSNVARKRVKVQNIEPLANAIANRTELLTFEEIGLKGNATDFDGRIMMFIWDFGDGNGSLGQNATHAYSDDGNYTVTLRTIDEDFGENITTLAITVKNRPPIIHLKYESRAKTGELMVFDATGSEDPDGSIVSFSWLIDGKTEEGMTINHSFEKAGTYISKAIGTDNDGSVMERSFEIQISNGSVNDTASPWILPAILLVLAIAAFVFFIRGARQK